MELSDIKMHPQEFGFYLLNNGFVCKFEGSGDDYAIYRKDNIEVWYYGTCVYIYIFTDKSRNCPTCGQIEYYTERDEVLWDNSCTLKILVDTVNSLNNGTN